MRLNIATAPRRDSVRWKQGTIAWDELVAWTDSPDDRKECGGYVLGRLKGAARTKETVVSRSGIALDADKATHGLPADVALLGYRALIHTTFSSCPDEFRLRLLFPTDRDMTPDEYRKVSRVLMEKLGVEQFDSSSDQPERYMFRPATQKPEWFQRWVVDGEPLDVEALMAQYVEPAAAERPAPRLAAPVDVADVYVRHTVAGVLDDLDALGGLSEGARTDHGHGWDSGVYRAACQLVRAANSRADYTMASAESDFMAHAPAASGTYDPAYKWASAVKEVREAALSPQGSVQDDFRPVPRSAPERLGEEVLTAEGGTSAGGWIAVDLTTYLDGTHTPPEATIMLRDDGVGLLYPGMTHSIHGESESGKSMIAQSVVAVLLKQGRRVLMLDYEADPGSVVERLRLMGVSDQQMRGLAYVQPEVDHGQSAATATAFASLIADKYDLAVLDGVTEALAQAPAKSRSTAGLGGNDDITAWHVRLPYAIARQTGAAVVLIDHVAKGPDAGRFAIGGQAKMATIGGAAYLVRPRSPLGRGMVGEVDVYVAKDRHGYVRSKAGEFTPDRLQLVATAVVDGTDGRLDVQLRTPISPTTGDDRLLEMMERVSTFLGGLPDGHAGAGVNLVRGEVTGNNGLIGQALRRLVAQGYVNQTVKGQSTLHTSVRPFIAGLDQAVGE